MPDIWKKAVVPLHPLELPKTEYPSYHPYQQCQSTEEKKFVLNTACEWDNPTQQDYTKY